MEKYKIPKSTLNKILQNQESLLNIVDSQSSLKVSKSACRLKDSKIPDVEQELYDWIVHFQAKGVPINGQMIKDQEKVISIIR